MNDFKKIAMARVEVAVTVLDASEGVTKLFSAGGATASPKSGGDPGTQRFVFKMEGRGHPAISPDGSVVYVGSYDSYLYAVDADSGQLKWKFQTGDWVASSPAPSPDGSVVYVGSGDSYLYAVDADSGQLKWKFQTA